VTEVAISANTLSHQRDMFRCAIVVALSLSAAGSLHTRHAAAIAHDSENATALHRWLLSSGPVPTEPGSNVTVTVSFARRVFFTTVNEGCLLFETAAWQGHFIDPLDQAR
jgi:hypothetical protein